MDDHRHNNHGNDNLDDIHSNQPPLNLPPQEKPVHSHGLSQQHDSQRLQNEIPHNSQDDDLDLENAIGNVFNQFDFNNDDNNHHANNDDFNQGQIDHRDLPDNDKDDNDSNENAAIVDVDKNNDQEEPDLNDAIANAFNNVFQNETSQEEEVQQEQVEHEYIDHDSKELDLEDAIGDAFKSAMVDNVSVSDNHVESVIENQRSDNQPHIAVESNSSELHSNSETKHEDDADDDLNLEDAIGDAFEGIFDEDKPSMPQKIDTNNDNHEHFQSNDNPKDKISSDADEDLDLNEAIGNAFKGIFESNKSEYENVASHTTERQAGSYLPHQIHVENIVDKSNAEEEEEEEEEDGRREQIKDKDEGEQAKEGEEKEEEDLNNAIGAALNSFAAKPTNLLSPKDQHNDSNNDDDSYRLNKGTDEGHSLDDIELNQLISASFHKLIVNNEQERPVEKQQEKDFDDNDDINMEDAIAQAFKSAMNDETKVNNNNNDTSRVFDEPHEVINIESISSNKENADLQSSNGTVLNELLSKRQKESDAERATNSPGNSNWKDSVNQNNNFNIGFKPSEPKEEVLESLEMSNILQNAFHMAMQRPKDLIEDMNTEDKDVKSRRNSTLSRTDEFTEKLATTLANYPNSITENTANFLESLKHSSDRDWNKREETDQFKTNEKNDSEKAPGVMSKEDGDSLSGGDLLLDSNTTSQMSPQLLNVIGNITSRIAKSGITTASDANILGVIRKMRDAFSTNLKETPKSSTDVPTVSEIVSSYKSTDDKSSILHSLNLAKSYMDTSVEVDTNKIHAKDLIDSVLQRFNLYSEFPHNNNIIRNENTMGLISTIRNSIISVIASSAPAPKISRTSTTTNEKFKTDSPEYREKIRIENRERKKKWREENIERNKDNDLRSRVIKRAVGMFGIGESKTKSIWIEEEFHKRREKRIAKQKKDDERFNPKDNQDPNKKFKDEVTSNLIKDPRLFKPVTDIFNMLSSFAHKENADAVLTASSIATASAAAVYANSNPNVGMLPISIAVNSILSSLIDDVKASGQSDRIANLANGTKSFASMISDKMLPTQQISEFTDEEFSSIMSNNIGESKDFESHVADTFGSVTSSYEGIDNSLSKHNINENPPNNPIPYPKRQKLELEMDLQSSYTENDNMNSAQWDPNSLKMPPYKKPTTSIYRTMIPSPNISYPTLTLPTTSPFISNKVNFANSNRVGQLVSGGGLRKPGSFQKPLHGSKPNENRFGSPQTFT